MAAINNDWLEALQGEFKKPYYKKIFETVKNIEQDRYFHRRMTFSMPFI